MHMRLGLTNGDIIVSDDWSREECEAHIAEHNGLLGSKGYLNVRVESVEDTLAFMEAIFVRIAGDEDGTFGVEVNGITREFPTNEVAWWRWVLDE